MSPEPRAEAAGRSAALRRRATIARNGIRQLIETADEQSIAGDTWEACRTAAATASRAVGGRKSSEEMEMGVAALERAQREMRLYLEAAFARQADSQSSVVPVSVDINSKEPENWPHITTTNQLLNPKDTVIAPEGGRFGAAGSPSPAHPTPVAATTNRGRGVENSKRTGANARTDSGSLLKITPIELMKLAPRLKPYLRDTSPRWPEIVEAADWLRDELGISKSIWGDACLAMGREQAAIAVAIVSAKPSNHFRGSPGAYFHGMVSKAKAGELHLARTIWGMRAQR